MNIHKARTILSLPYENMTLERLQKHRVELIDAWRHSKASYGFPQAVAEGFYKVVESNYASGYTPSDMWLTHNLLYKLEAVEALEQKILNA